MVHAKKCFNCIEDSPLMNNSDLPFIYSISFPILHVMLGVAQKLFNTAEENLNDKDKVELEEVLKIIGE